MVQVASAGKSVFGFASIGHFFASALSDLQKACVLVEKVGTSTESSAGTIEAISGLIPGFGSQAVVIERAAFSALGLVVAAVHSTGTAAGANGLSVSLDEATAQAFEQLISSCKGDLASLGYKI